MQHRVVELAGERAAARRRRPAHGSRRRRPAARRRAPFTRKCAARALAVDLDRERAVADRVALDARSTGGSAMPLRGLRAGSTRAATSSAIFVVSSASLLGGISLSTRRQSRARLPRTPSAVVQKKSAWSRRTLRLSTSARQAAGAGQHGQQRQLGQRHRARAVVDQQDLVAGQRQLVAAAGGDAVDRADVDSGRDALTRPRWPARVSLVNLQKFTL